MMQTVGGRTARAPARADGPTTEDDEMTKIREVMTRDVCVANPNQTLKDAASTMARADIGSLPVGENDRLVGMITDRDMVLRAIAMGLGAGTKIREVMSEQIKYCFEDDDVSEVAANMADLGIRRLPVISRDKRLVGIVSLSNIVQSPDDDAKDALLDGVAKPH